MLIVAIIKKLLAIWEIFIGIRLTQILIMHDEEAGKKEFCISIIFSIILGMLLAFNRKISLVSWAMVLFCTLTSFVYLGIIIKKRLMLLGAVIWSYYSMISIIEILFAYIAMVIFPKSFNRLIYMDYSTLARDVIYLIACIILTLLLIIIKKMKKKKKIILYYYRYYIYLGSIIVYVVLWNYHGLLDDIVHGIEKMRNTTILSLILAMALLGTGGIIILRYKMLEKEYEALVIQDKMNIKKYREISEVMYHNEQLRHDMKNHLLIIRRYIQENNIEDAGKYLNSIDREYVTNNLKYWTGNKIIDTILSQKENQAREHKIEFTVDTCLLSTIKIDEGEMCSMLGNILDNAFEATIQAKEPWIKVVIRKQNSLVFIDVRNSYSIKPILKKGEFVTSKIDKSVHGYGIKCIKRIVEKYEGIVSFRTCEDVFVVQITFFDIEYN